MRRAVILQVLLLISASAAFVPHRFSSTATSSFRLFADKKPFDEEAYEQDRLAKDTEAMSAMKEKAAEEFSNLRTPWKWKIRKRIWDLMEEKDIARFPRPVHHRIPNFDGAELAAERLSVLPEFQRANCIKVNPDTPQRPVRHLVLEQGKTLLTPQPRLRTGFFSMLSMDTLPGVSIEECTNSKGVAKHGTPVSLNDEYTVDLVIVGSTAVCPSTGARVGKGEGFAELEWGILSLQGNLDASKTLVVTTVHDEQVVNDIPPGQLTKHDVPVDIIVTPTRVIRVPNRAPKPSGVFWDLLSPQKLGQIRALRQLKEEIEKRDKLELPSGPDEVLPPTASRGGKKQEGEKRNRNQGPSAKISSMKPQIEKDLKKS
jgi:5-formyltetrahydrofolate cyclo-ligase